MKKSFKRIIAVAMVLTMFAGLGSISFAAGTGFKSATPPGQEEYPGDISTSTPGADVFSLEKNYGEKLVSELNQDIQAVFAAAGKTLPEKREVLAVVNVEGTPGVPIKFDMKSVSAKDDIYVMHGITGANEITWELITPDKVEDGAVTATFNSFSPAIFLRKAVETTPGEGGALTPDNGVKKSPKTGEF